MYFYFKFSLFSRFSCCFAKLVSFVISANSRNCETCETRPSFSRNTKILSQPVSRSFRETKFRQKPYWGVEFCGMVHPLQRPLPQQGKSNLLLLRKKCLYLQGAIVPYITRGLLPTAFIRQSLTLSCLYLYCDRGTGRGRGRKGQEEGLPGYKARFKTQNFN